MILIEHEINTILSMNEYWEEVKKRTDTTPLIRELEMITERFGTRILFIIADYAKLKKGEI